MAAALESSANSTLLELEQLQKQITALSGGKKADSLLSFIPTMPNSIILASQKPGPKKKNR